ncbi:ComEA family DNA-binding protein [Legionella fairfieldensis]|uniref:ComEA family DNA-binding protein n=1 Tax=Legionella fairfieldensis TaxID=45064 RepID=UPI00048FCD3A|nr:helix-hairpin-helix domain-containing protein [Legionella fairfieldensis]
MKANLFAIALSLFIICLPEQVSYAESGNATKLSHPKAKIDLNSADAKMLSKSVKGIGQKRAEAIIKYREEHGHFKSIDDLAQVRGLGHQFVKNHLTQLQEAFSIN